MERLDYRFAQPQLLEQALTHRSSGPGHNERLEFLGDGLLNFVAAKELYALGPRQTEGELSRLRATLVCEATLAEIARELKLADCLRLGQGARNSGGGRRDSILADTLEAIFGAVFLDSGFDAAAHVILHCYGDRIGQLPPPESLKDPKTRLQEYLQARRLALPEYTVLEITGVEHDQHFRVGCRVANVEDLFIGEGYSRREAEQSAAAAAIDTITMRKE